MPFFDLDKLAAVLVVAVILVLVVLFVLVNATLTR